MTIAAPTRLLEVDPAGLPEDLVNDASWYPAIIKPKVGKVGKLDKIPGNPETGAKAKWSDPATRCTFNVAYMAYQNHPEWFRGIGYMMRGNGRVGIDLDECVSPDGTIASWAQEIVDQFNGAHWSLSVSGSGLRGFCDGVLPDGVEGRKSTIEGHSVEIYAGLRFLVVTGRTIRPWDGGPLPTLQEAVDAFYTRINKGRVHSTGTAVASGLTGQGTNLSPEHLDILTAVMSDPRKGVRMGEIWGRDDLDVAGASEDDFAIECEIAYQHLSREDTLAALMKLDDATRQAALGTITTTTEIIMRTGPFRLKWDEPRGRVTWLAQDCANAVQTTYDRLKEWRESHPDFTLIVDDEDATDEAIPADETWQQTIDRLERALAAERAAHAQTRAVNAVQMTNLRSARTELEEKTGFLSHISNILAKPNEELSAGEKVVALGNLIEIHFRASASPYKLPDGSEGSYRLPNGKVRMTRNVIALRTGYSPNQASKIARQIAERENAPYRWDTVREWGTRQDGSEGWITKIEVEPLTERTADSLRAIATLPALPSKLKHGGSQAAVDARERVRRGCEHQDDDVIVNGICATGGEDLGDRRLTAKEWEALEHQLDVPDRGRPTVSVSVLKVHQVDVPDATLDARATAMVQTPLLRDTADKWKQYAPKPANLGPILLSDHRSTPDDVDTVPEEAAWLREWPDDSFPAVICTRCSEPVAPGQKLYCVAHVAEADQTVMPWERPAAMAGGEE